MDQAAANKNVILNLVRVADEGDLSAIRRFYSHAYIDHDPSQARQGDASDLENTMAGLKAFQEAFPDTRHTIHDMVAEGDRVAVRISAEGTHSGKFFGIAPTGCRVSNESIVIYRIVDGVIVERWCRETRGTLDQLSEVSRTNSEDLNR